MGRITSRGCARNYWITLDFVSCDPMFLAQPLDVIRPIRLSYLSNNVYVSFLDLCRLSYFEVKTSLNKPLSQSGFFFRFVCSKQALVMFPTSLSNQHLHIYFSFIIKAYVLSMLTNMLKSESCLIHWIVQVSCLRLESFNHKFHPLTCTTAC